MTRSTPRTRRDPNAPRRSPLALALALSVLAATAVVPAGASSDDVQARNVEFLLAALGLASVPEGTATAHVNGATTEMPIAQAFAESAARAGETDLAALLAGATTGPAFATGDVWVIEIGNGACPTPTTLPLSPPRIASQPQLQNYGGTPGHVVTPGGSGTVIDWTLKVTTTYAGSVLVAGFSDWYCVSFFGLYVFFPYVNGTVTDATHRPAVGEIVITDPGTGPSYTSTFPGQGFTCTPTSGLSYVVRCVAPAAGPPFAGWKCTGLVVGAHAPTLASRVRGELDCRNTGGAGVVATTGDVVGPSAWVSAAAPDAAGIVEVRCAARPVSGGLAPVPPFTVSCAEP